RKHYSVRIWLQNHPLARVVEDDSELAQNFHPDVPSEMALDGRAFEKVVRLRFVHGQAAQLDLGDRTDLCLGVAAHADAAAIGNLAISFEQLVSFDEVMPETESVVTTGVDFESPLDRRAARNV